MIHDLHTHTTASDGSLSPADLLTFAAEHDVRVLSITDHDTVAAYRQLVVPAGSPLAVVPGVELSTHWQGRNIHVVGLNIDPDNAVLQKGLLQQQQARIVRATIIANRLTRLDIENPMQDVQALAGKSVIGRPHFAQHLVNIGKVRDIQTAFRKYLGAGKMGDVKAGWAPMSDVIAWIRAAGGTPVLAHPAKYRFTMTRLRAMLEDFIACGGLGIEISCGHQEPSLTRKLASLATDMNLLGSTGSDFHHKHNRWSRPGGFSTMPATVEPVWNAW